jgi:hypothetical protein
MGMVQRLIGAPCAIVFVLGVSHAQSSNTVRELGGAKPLSCSPAPCVLTATQVSSGLYGAVDAPIAADPPNPERIIVGSDDYNCAPQSGLSFYLTSNGGSSWDTFCMVPLFSGNQEYIPDVDPILGYDRDGIAYIGGFYLDDNGRTEFGFEGFEKSSDGVNWSNPAPAVVRQNYDPSYCWMAVDDSAISPYMNSVYISCVMVGLNNQPYNQVVVAHSNNGGATWQQVNVAPMQKSPDRDFYTALVVGRDGTVYLTWMYCNTGPQACDNDKAYMVFSKSSDGGNTWSPPKLVAAVTLITFLPNTSIFVRDGPAIGVDNGNGPYAGNLYVSMYNWTGTFMQVQVARSTDGGSDWSKPVPVAPGITHDQFFPWISISPSGLVGVSWLDRRNDPNNVDYQAFGAISANGGLGFQANVQLTTGFSNPTTTMGFSIGNYTGNTWDGPSYFLAAWMDNSQTTNMQDFVGGIRLK